MGYKVIKGSTRKAATLDSTHDDHGKAKTRAATLRSSIRGSKTQVWVVPMEATDPPKYQKPNVSRGY